MPIRTYNDPRPHSGSLSIQDGGSFFERSRKLGGATIVAPPAVLRRASVLFRLLATREPGVVFHLPLVAPFLHHGIVGTVIGVAQQPALHLLYQVPQFHQSLIPQDSRSLQRL